MSCLLEVCYTFSVVKDDSKITPVYLVIDLGDKVSFTCYSDEGLTKWFFKVPNTAGRLSEKSNTLFFNQVMLNDAGYYYCYGYYEKKHKYFIARAELRVRGELLTCIHY